MTLADPTPIRHTEVGRSTLAVMQPYLFPYLGYFTIAAARYYDTSLLAALWRGVAHMALYLFGVLLPAALIVYMTVLDWKVWWAWISA